MSTRSAIGIYTNSTKTQWKARYCHFDGYPSGVGAHLYSEYRRAFKDNLQAMIDILLAERVGWSSICGADLTLTPVWRAQYNKDQFGTYDNYLVWLEQQAKAPQSFTARGETSDKADGEWILSNGDHGGTEYAYIFDVQAVTMTIYKMYYRGILQGGDVWRRINTIDLNTDDPNFEAFDSAEAIDLVKQAETFINQTPIPDAPKPPARHIDTAEVAKLIRADLKAVRAWKSVKFSVTSKRYAGGSSIDIRWTDGPTVAEVKAISCKYEGATFDGMTDLKSYHDSMLNGEVVSFGADFIFEHREISTAFFTELAREVAQTWGVEELPTIKSNSSGHGFFESDPRIKNADEYFGTLVYRLSVERSKVSTKGAKINKTQAAAGASNTVPSVRNFRKGVVYAVAVEGTWHIGGDTYKHRGEIKAAGAVWNKDLIVWQIMGSLPEEIAALCNTISHDE